MKLFGRTPGYYLFWAGVIYMIAAPANGYFKFVDQTLLSIAWVSCLIVPLMIKPVADYFNMSTIWDQLKPRVPMNDYQDNVYNLPTPKLVPPVEPPKEEPAKIFYRIGATDKNRVAFSMGMMEITMNKEGVANMIAQLEVFMNQLTDEEDYGDL